MGNEKPASQQTEKRRPGRPREMEMPPPIPDSPENILRTVLAGPPKKRWWYLEEHEQRAAKRSARSIK